MPKFLGPILADIRNGENLDVYIGELFLIVLGALSLFQLQLVTALTLGTLALLLQGTLSTRRTLGNVNQSIQTFKRGQSAEAFLKDRDAYSPLKETIVVARKICLIGPTLINIFSSASKQVNIKLQQGAVIQVLLLNPASPAVDSAAQCMNEPIENLRRDIERTLLYVEDWFRIGIGKGSFEVRLMSAHPNFSMVLIDPEEPQGRMILEIIGYHGGLTERPHIELTRERDGRWYEYFLQQYHKLWEDSGIWRTSQP